MVKLGNFLWIRYEIMSDPYVILFTEEYELELESSFPVVSCYNIKPTFIRTGYLSPFENLSFQNYFFPLSDPSLVLQGETFYEAVDSLFGKSTDVIYKLYGKTYIQTQKEVENRYHFFTCPCECCEYCPPPALSSKNTNVTKSQTKHDKKKTKTKDTEIN